MNKIKSFIIADPGCKPDPDKMLRFMGGKIVDSETIQEKAEVIACGNLLPSSNTIYGFSSDDEFQEWASYLPIGNTVHLAYSFVKEAQKYENDDLGSIEASCAAYVESTTHLLKKLAKSKGLEENSLELFLAAEGLSDHPLEPKILNSALLYDGYNFVGSWRPVSLTIPKLSWIGFNDKTSSVRVVGTGFLAQHTWYRGRKFWMLGIPYMQYPDLRKFDFNNRASSVLMT